MTKDEIKEEVKKAIEAPSCCEELKEVGKEYLDAVGTSGEETAAGLLKAAKEAKAHGEKFCICDACQAGGKVLVHKEDLL